MDGNLTRTPYNTIYKALKDEKQEGEFVCCVHAQKCAYGRDTKADENQYVNLALPKKEKEKREKEQDVANQLTAKLNKLATEETPQPRGKPEMMSLNSLLQVDMPRKKKSQKKRKGEEKKPTQMVDDNQSYVMLGNSSEDEGTLPTSAISSSLPSHKPLDYEKKPRSPLGPQTETSTNNSEVVPSKSPEPKTGYIGVSSLSAAESRLTRRGEFALYHLFTPNERLDTLSSGLPLMLVYCTTTRKYRHYTIRTTEDHQFFVDCGYPNVRRHFSINQLILYYKTSAALEINPNDTSADSFSWWLE
uniref:SH2 domain-containing protein n=1 Tax=Caenorhabditis japonica TaxID=281687 RepID=A0A8R1I204_CAEJA